MAIETQPKHDRKPHGKPPEEDSLFDRKIGRRGFLRTGARIAGIVGGAVMLGGAGLAVSKLFGASGEEPSTSPSTTDAKTITPTAPITGAPPTTIETPVVDVSEQEKQILAVEENIRGFMNFGQPDIDRMAQQMAITFRGADWAIPVRHSDGATQTGKNENGETILYHHYGGVLRTVKGVPGLGLVEDFPEFKSLGFLGKEIGFFNARVGERDTVPCVVTGVYIFGKHYYFITVANLGDNLIKSFVESNSTLKLISVYQRYGDHLPSVEDGVSKYSPIPRSGENKIAASSAFPAILSANIGKPIIVGVQQISGDGGLEIPNQPLMGDLVYSVYDTLRNVYTGDGNAFNSAMDLYAEQGLVINEKSPRIPDKFKQGFTDLSDLFNHAAFGFMTFFKDAPTI